MVDVGPRNLSIGNVPVVPPSGFVPCVRGVEIKVSDIVRVVIGVHVALFELLSAVRTGTSIVFTEAPLWVLTVSVTYLFSIVASSDESSSSKCYLVHYEIIDFSVAVSFSFDSIIGCAGILLDSVDVAVSQFYVR